MSIIRLKPIVEQIVKEYTGEEDLSKRRAVWIGMEEAVSELKTRFSEACEMYAHSDTWGIYRGYTTAKHREKSSNDVYFIDPKKSTRTSKETNNFYTEWISTSPLWENYPPRDKSVIGSFSKNIASDYGSLIFLVVPSNGAKFAIVSDKDAWASFPHAFSFFQTDKYGGVGLDNMVDIMAHFFSIASQMFKIDWVLSEYNGVLEMLDKNIDQFLAKIEPHRKEIIENIQKIRDHVEGSLSGVTRKKMVLTFIDSIEKTQHLSSFEKMFDDMFDPEKNKIDLVNGIKPLYEKYDYSDRELWTDSECLLVPLTFRNVNNNIFVKVRRGEI